MGHFTETTTFDRPFGDAGFASLIGNEKEVQNLVALLRHTMREEMAAQLSALEDRLTGKYAALPEVASAQFWASKKGYAKGKTYTANYFERWARAARLSHLKTEGGFWPKEVGVAWLEG